jgi:hypothetical protein
VARIGETIPTEAISFRVVLREEAVRCGETKEKGEETGFGSMTGPVQGCHIQIDAPL